MPKQQIVIQNQLENYFILFNSRVYQKQLLHSKYNKGF